MSDDHQARPEGETGKSPVCLMRYAFIALGLIAVALGVIGIVVPGMPTTVFLLIALWAFSRGSDRLRLWLWEHPRLGPPLQAWHQHRVIPPRAKVMALSMMTASVLVTAALVEGWGYPLLILALVVGPAVFIATRPGQAPTAAVAVRRPLRD